MSNLHILKTIQEGQKEERFFPVFVLDVEQTFPMGVRFKKVTVGFKFDNEAKKVTEEMDSIQIFAEDIKTKEVVKVKLPINADIPEDIMDRTDSPIRFAGMTGGRHDKGFWFKADAIEFL